jgi:hypothetical protein
MSDQRLAKKGAVTVQLPDGRTVNGKITNTATVIETDDSSTGSGAGGNSSSTETKLKVTVAVSDQKALAGLDDASAGVAFTASRREKVLTVPVAALLALAEGGYGVQLVDSGGTRIVAVRTGLFASGRVEVSGAGVTEGATAVIPG